MSENTEDIVLHAENAARSLAEYVTELQYRGTGIEYPVEASFIDSHLTRAAGEMTTASLCSGPPWKASGIRTA